MEDQRDILKSIRPYRCVLSKDGRAFIYWQWKLIKIIKGSQVAELENVMQAGDEYQLQLLLAKLSGHFKHGNERDAANERENE